VIKPTLGTIVAVGDHRHGCGVDRSKLEPAGRRGMPEGGNLGFVQASGKLGGLRFGGGVGDGGVAGELGVSRVRGGVGAAGEESGEEASEAQGSNFNEKAFGAGSRQERHELRSRGAWVVRELRQAYPGASEATMPPSVY